MSTAPSSWRRILALSISHARDHPWRIVFALTCLICAKLANTAVPIVLKSIVDHLGAEAAIAVTPLVLLLLFGGLRLSVTLFDELRNYMAAVLGSRQRHDLLLLVFRHLHGLSVRFHLNRQVGSVMRDIELGVEAVVQSMRDLLFTLTPLFIELSMVAFVLYAKFDWRFAAITCGSVAVYLAFTLLVSKRRMAIRREANALIAGASAHAMDSLLNFETARSHGRHEYEVARYAAWIAPHERVSIREARAMSTLLVGHSLIVAVATTWLLFLVVEGQRAGTLTIGDIVLANGLLIQAFIPLLGLGNMYAEIIRLRVDAERMFELLDTVPEVVDSPTAVDLPAGPATVAFHEADFQYGADRRILRDVSFEIAANQTVAVVGHSGAGKSTLARLLLRFYDVTHGAVLVGGIDVRRLRQSSLTAAVACVPQEGVLFNESIRFNIQYGNESGGEGALIAAAQAAGIHDFIVSLPEGYDTLVGERGLKLSAGERQRVVIARALIRNPAVLILDEATSALDSATEQSIQDALRRASRGRATLVIAHRLSTVVDADQILVLDQGTIIERGTHHGLLKSHGQYARLWELQRAEAATAAGTLRLLRT
jgi:ATP-binding cassette, subfamily B, heavy metal transporter